MARSSAIGWSSAAPAPAPGTKASPWTPGPRPPCSVPGYPDSPHVAHQISVPRLHRTISILALDGRHQQTLRSLGIDQSRLFLLRSFDPSEGVGTDVPDPYYGDDAEFDTCLEMIANGCKGLVAALRLAVGGTAHLRVTAPERAADSVSTL